MIRNSYSDNRGSKCTYHIEFKLILTFSVSFEWLTTETSKLMPDIHNFRICYHFTWKQPKGDFRDMTYGTYGTFSTLWKHLNNIKLNDTKWKYRSTQRNEEN